VAKCLNGSSWSLLLGLSHGTATLRWIGVQVSQRNGSPPWRMSTSIEFAKSQRLANQQLKAYANRKFSALFYATVGQLLRSCTSSVWRSANGAGRINEVTLRRARLVLKGATVSVRSQPSRPTQSPTLSGTGNEYRPKCGDAL